MNVSLDQKFQNNVRSLQQVISNYGLVFSLGHHEVLKRARKKLYSKQPICFVSSPEPLLSTHYKKMISDFLVATNDREIIFYSGGSAERLISIINEHTEDLSVETIVSPQNAIEAKEKAIIIVEREEELMPDEWAILESMARELRHGTLGLIVNLQNSYGNIARDSINKDLIFEFRELSKSDWDTLKRVKITPDLSKGFEYLASVLEKRNKDKEDAAKKPKNGKSSKQEGNEVLVAKLNKKPSSKSFAGLGQGNLSFIVFVILLFCELAYFAGRLNIFGL